MKFPPPGFERKIRAPETLARAITGASRPLVFTNGVFDLLHRGHATCLAQARALGAALVVALNSDASARRLGKGPDRPVNPLAIRAAGGKQLAGKDLANFRALKTRIVAMVQSAPSSTQLAQAGQ